MRQLPRVKVEGGDSLWMFKQICRGGIDRWKAVDRWLHRVQNSNRQLAEATPANN
jgi:hypothetical protein